MWLATRNDAAGVWNQAGGSFATEYGGLWDDEESDGDDDAGSNSRRNELVFIGLGMDEEALKAELQLCLLTEGEMAAGGAEGWGKRFADPFPPWE